MAPIADRLASAQAISDGRRLVATAVESRLGTRYSVDTLRQLQRRFPCAKFVWLTGADNFVELPLWHRWRQIAKMIPIAVLPRPGATRRALASQAAQCLRHGRLPARSAPILANSCAPRWSLLPIRENPLSATAVRAGLVNGQSRLFPRRPDHRPPPHPLGSADTAHIPPARHKKAAKTS